MSIAIAKKPILFNTAMVQSTLAGMKTKTRRPVKDINGKPPAGEWMGEVKKGGSWCSNPNPSLMWTGFYNENQVFYVDGERHIDGSYCKFLYCPGDVLWVRETWANDSNGNYVYRADRGTTEDDSLHSVGFKWRPSIHMPREAARLFLSVKDVRVERLQDISEDDARAEGAVKAYPTIEGYYLECDQGTHKGGFACLWDSIYAKQGFSWEVNPYVWVTGFNMRTMEAQ